MMECYLLRNFLKLIRIIQATFEGPPEIFRETLSLCGPQCTDDWSIHLKPQDHINNTYRTSSTTSHTKLRKHPFVYTGCNLKPELGLCMHQTRDL